MLTVTLPVDNGPDVPIVVFDPEAKFSLTRDVMVVAPLSNVVDVTPAVELPIMVVLVEPDNPPVPILVDWAFPLVVAAADILLVVGPVETPNDPVVMEAVFIVVVPVSIEPAERTILPVPVTAGTFTPPINAGNGIVVYPVNVGLSIIGMLFEVNVEPVPDCEAIVGFGYVPPSIPPAGPEGGNDGGI